MRNPSTHTLLYDLNYHHLLGYFNGWRLLLAVFFILLNWATPLSEITEEYNGALFALGAYAYLITALMLFVPIYFDSPRYMLQATLHVGADIIFIVVMMYANGGINSGFGLLLVVSVTIAGVLCSRRMAMLLAAVCSIAVLCEEFYGQLTWAGNASNYTHAGLLGASFFLTAYLGNALSQKAADSEALASKHAQDLATMAEINALIVQKMQPGIIVTDTDLNIHLMNHATASLLGKVDHLQYTNIDDLCPILSTHLKAWQQMSGSDEVLFASKNGSEILASFVRLGLQKKLETLIFLDNISLAKQHAQKMKLASLGRLTANIAHEVRNPLAAISHAGQLLLESNALTKADSRLAQIIIEHTSRINRIIDNVLYLSRGKPMSNTTLELAPWLAKFTAELTQRYNLSSHDVDIQVPADLKLHISSAEQLYQIMWNLSENALRYSTASPRIAFVAKYYAKSTIPHLDIIDRGSGMTQKTAEKIFEPFFTTEKTGSGLGLYIARELCEVNQARLNLYQNSPAGCIFRIDFAYSPEQTHAKSA